MSLFPAPAAPCRAVHPSAAGAFMSTPVAIAACTRSSLPRAADLTKCSLVFTFFCLAELFATSIEASTSFFSEAADFMIGFFSIAAGTANAPTSVFLLVGFGLC